MAVCGDKVCEAKTSPCCDNIIPSICGDRGLDFPSDSCSTVRIEGISDTTINQGLGIDLTDGVHAYDGDGNEIPFEVEPDAIDKCDVGEHLVKYTASGQGTSMRPSLCGNNALAVSDACSDLATITIEEDRIVTITQADPPTINGIDEVQITTSTMFDPTDGVSAVDDNGNIIPFEYSGEYDLMASGDIASFETEYAQNAKSVSVSLSPIQDLNGYDKPWAGGNGYNQWDEEWEQGGLVNATGETFSATDRIRSKNFSPCLGDTDYYCKAPTQYLSIFWYDSEQAFISREAGVNRVVTSPTNARYFKIVLANGVQTYGNDISVNYPSTITSYSPYSNICPISGRTEVVTNVSGANIIDDSLRGFSNEVLLRGSWYAQAFISGESAINSRLQYLNDNNTWVYIVTAPFEADGFTLTAVSGNVNPFGWMHGNGTYLIEVTKPTKFRFSTGSLNGTRRLSISPTRLDSFVEYVQGTTYTTALGQTVYGGTLDVVSGELTIDWVKTTVGALGRWYYSESGNFFYNQPTPSKSEFKFYCDSYPYVDNIGATTEDKVCGAHYTFMIAIRDSEFSTPEEFVTAREDVELVYKIYHDPESQDYNVQLTPQQVQLLLGENNVWSDGDVEVIYEANIPQSDSFRYPVAGTYEITYTAEDECGNTVETTRIIEVR